ncbi:helix-turn-helix domain-containing protein [Enterococcus faecium]|uniref:helix-turn-helix domain-containing protein n=1 Tax=Enterococcus faecium TaxID=1352 RepID=UPI001E6111BC|nr:helix-turn-helix transcriptional regulator [Enterococcus faecium]
MTISKVIKQKRIEKQLTQEDIAEMLLVSKKNISNWENGRTIPDTENLIQFAKLFDLSLDNILLGEEKIMVKNHTKTLILLFHFVIFLSLVFTLIQSGFFYFSHSIATWLLIFFLSLLLIINTLIIIFNKHRNLFLREYKIFCVNEKIHTKKEVPSVE